MEYTWRILQIRDAPRRSGPQHLASLIGYYSGRRSASYEQLPKLRGLVRLLLGVYRFKYRSQVLACPDDEEATISAHDGLDEGSAVKLADPSILLEEVHPHRLDGRLERELQEGFRF